MTLPSDARQRKGIPMVTGVLDYFPDAIAAVADVSMVGNKQHNPGQPLHWDKTKSTDHADSLLRHLVDRGKMDSDGVRHSAKVAWRALALLQTEIEKATVTEVEYGQQIHSQTNTSMVFPQARNINAEYSGYDGSTPVVELLPAFHNINDETLVLGQIGEMAAGTRERLSEEAQAVLQKALNESYG